MANVILQNNVVVGIFFMPQPHLEGYTELPDNDQRVLDYINQQQGV